MKNRPNTLGHNWQLGGIPAEKISTSEQWQDGVLFLEVKGFVRERNVFGENLVLERCYRVSSAANTINLSDRIVNEGSEKQQLMLLYHINWGHPLLSPELKLLIDHNGVGMSEGEESEKALWNHFSDTEPGIAEKVYFFKPKTGQDGKASYCLENPVLGKGVRVSWDRKDLPLLTEWKMMGAGEYVLGLEPGNTYPIGRRRTRDEGTPEYLDPNEVKEISLQISFYDSSST